MNRLFTSFVQNHVFANIIFIVILLAGMIAVTRMVKEDLPVMAHDLVEVSMVWEGADPVNIEEGILRKIEMATQGLDGILDIRTIAENSLGKAVFLVQSGYDSGEVFDRIRASVDSISGFPKEAEKPVIVQPVQTFAVMTLFINGHVDEKTLKETGLAVKDELQRLEPVSKVFLDGARDYEISIEVSLSTLEQYGLTIRDIARLVARNNLDLAGGTITRQDQRFAILTKGKKDSGQMIGRIIAVTSAAGEQIPLSRIATIKDGFVDADSYVKVNGKPGILINIYKNSEEDAIRISKAVRAYLDTKKGTLARGVEMDILFDTSVATRGQIESLVKNGAYGLLFVMFILWLFIDARLAFWVAAGIPFSILGGLAILWYCGGTLNMVSLFSLIMVLGIIADDAIVMGEAILFHRQQGKDPVEAVAAGIKEVGLPVLIAVTTSVVAFLPLLFIPGMMGRLIAILPVTVIACLLISLVECFVLLPVHLNPVHPNRGNHTGKNRLNKLYRLVGQKLEQFVQQRYMPFLSATLRHRYLTLSSGISLLLITTGLLLGGFLPFNLFPDTQGKVITATIEFPDGTGINTTRRAVEKLNQALDRTVHELKDHDGGPVVVSRISLSGHLLGDESGEVEETDTRFGSVQAVLVPADNRDVSTMEILEMWQAQVPDIVEASAVNLFSDTIGMPDAPIVIHLLGDDLEALSQAAGEVKGYLKKFDAVFQVKSDLARKINEFQLSLKPSARALGISLSELSSQIRDSYFGKKALTLQQDLEEVDIYVRLSESERENLSSLDRFKITTPDGDRVPLSIVASVTPGTSVSRIERKNRLRKVSISAWVKGKEATADQIMDLFEESYIPVFQKQYPGIEIAEGGDEEEENMTFGSLLYGFPMAMFVIYMIIAATFKSYVQPLLVLLVIPFGIAGAMAGHLILGHALSLMSIFGMVAVSGVLINDAIVLMDSIATSRKNQASTLEAVMSGCKRRFRAVFLTSISTIAGLIPLIMESNPHIQLLIPMAVSIAGGIGFSTIITLVLVPVFVLILNDIQTCFMKAAY